MNPFFSVCLSRCCALTFLFYVVIFCGEKVHAAQLDKINNAQASETFEIAAPKSPSHDDSRDVPLPEIVRLTVARKFESMQNNTKIESLDDFVRHFNVSERFDKRAGVFVTLSKKGKTRTCWGTIEPRYKNIVEGTVRTTAQALANDYRYVPLKLSELRELKPQVTVVKKVVPIANLHNLNPLIDGLMVRKGTKTGVILPGEASDSYYELMLCKVKARIAPKENCQLYRIVADVYK